MIGVDFETNGLHPATPIEIGVVRYLPHQERFEILANHVLKGAKYITRAAYNVHGISLRDTWRGSSISDFQDLMDSLAGEEICVHAHGTEKKIMREWFGITEVTFIDTLTLSRREYKGFPNHKLATVTQQLGLEPMLKRNCPRLGWHRAAFDAGASALIAHHLKLKKEQNKLI